MFKQSQTIRYHLFCNGNYLNAFQPENMEGLDLAMLSQGYFSELCLVGKLLTNRPIRFGSMRDMLE